LKSENLNSLSGAVVDGAIAFHRVLGPGLLESAYQSCLAHELRKRGLSVATEVALLLVYDSQRLDVGYRMDSWFLRLPFHSVWPLCSLW